MLTLIADTLEHPPHPFGARSHDLLYCRCDSRMYAMVYGRAGAPNCNDNLSEAISEFGLAPEHVHDPFNIFMTTGLNDAGKPFYSSDAKKGDNVELVAEIGCLVAVSACPGGSSGSRSLSLMIEIFSQGESFREARHPKDMLDLASHIVAQKKAQFEPEKFEDQYEDALKELLKKKRAGEKIEAPKPRVASNVVNLMDAVRESIEWIKAAGTLLESRKPRAASRRRTAKKVNSEHQTASISRSRKALRGDWRFRTPPPGPDGFVDKCNFRLILYFCN